MTDNITALNNIHKRMDQACHAAQRPTGAVSLLAVSKTREAQELANLAAQGQRHFGESYLQEALPKLDALADLDLVWHFIGPVQSNKTRELAQHFHWVHSVDRLKIARRLSAQRPSHLPPLNICLQINVDNEPSKQGVPIEQASELADSIMALPNLHLRGLMAIPRSGAADHNQAAFTRLAMTLADLQTTIDGLDTLSMGMSNDFETAIACGATFIRIGRALFGPRS